MGQQFQHKSEATLKCSRVLEASVNVPQFFTFIEWVANEVCIALSCLSDANQLAFNQYRLYDPFSFHTGKLNADCVGQATIEMMQIKCANDWPAERYL